MANELTLSALMEYSDSLSTAESLQVDQKQVTVTIKRPLHYKQLIAFASDTALELGTIAALGWVLIINRDTTNFVTLKTAASGTIIAKLFPGEFCFFRIGSGITAPAMRADTGDCEVEYILSAA